MSDENEIQQLEDDIRELEKRRSEMRENEFIPISQSLRDRGILQLGELVGKTRPQVLVEGYDSEDGEIKKYLRLKQELEIYRKVINEKVFKLERLRPAEIVRENGEDKPYHHNPEHDAAIIPRRNLR